MPQVAISADFLRAFAKLPRAQQKKARVFMEKFKADPTQASIDYEPIHDMRDPKVRTVRIDQAYRAIVIHPPQGDVYVCVWVDHHDEAMRWARNKVFEVNAHTGSFQVWEPREGEAAPARTIATAARDAIPPERLLSGHDDETLMLLGVPEPLVPAVRALRTERDLDELIPYLPQEAADALFLLAAGYSLDDTLEELDRMTDAGKPDVPARVDTEDFAAALARPESKRSFKIVEDDHDLASILNAPLAQWRIFLHPSQERLVRMHSNGPARVLGGAGTGKTVVAMHRARHLAREVFGGPGERILFTTFTRNLAADIERNLRNLCGSEVERIEVTNLHAWARQLLTSRGARVKVPGDTQCERLWERVYEEHGDEAQFRLSFYRQEWDYVAQPQGIVDLPGYLRARRTGRGTRLTRNQRREVWRVLAQYRLALDDAGYMEQADVIREARLTIENNPGILPYRAVVADEVQDFSEADLCLLRAIVPEGANDLFVVGDAHQRIYGHHASLGRAGINIRGRRSRRLKVNYRTTQQIRNFAVGLLEGVAVDDLDEGTDDARGYHSLRIGEVPALCHETSAAAEGRCIIEHVRAWVDGGVPASDICLVARRNELVEQRYRPLLENAGIATVLIRTDADRDEGQGVRLASMHRVKGLEFPRMILASVQAGEVPLRLRDELLPDEAARLAHEESERRLLYVAATRARDALLVTGYGDPCPFLRDA